MQDLLPHFKGNDTMQKIDLTIPIVGILRGVKAGFFPKLVQASFSAGLQAIEVTMNTPGGTDMVKACREYVEGNQLLGMGTICNVEEAKKAIDAGAMFLVTPSFSDKVIDYGVKINIPVIAGALTPTEIYDAWSAGAAMIKVFPCQAMGGPRYIADLKGPFDEIPLAAVGGVSFASLEEYFRSGVKAVGVSSTLFGKCALAEEDLASVIGNIKKFTREVKRITQKLEKSSFYC